MAREPKGGKLQNGFGNYIPLANMATDMLMSVHCVWSRASRDPHCVDPSPACRVRSSTLCRTRHSLAGRPASVCCCYFFRWKVWAVDQASFLRQWKSSCV